MSGIRRLRAGRRGRDTRVPLATGFPARRAWLHLTVQDANGQVVFESGATNPDGSILGNDNDLDPAAYEPHYLSIDSPEQVQIYEAIMGNVDGQVTTILLAAAQYLKDNRLLPTGFDKSSVLDDIAVRGTALGDDDFGAGFASDAHHGVVIGNGDHTVGTDDTVRGDGEGFGEFIAQSGGVGGEEVAAVKVTYRVLVGSAVGVWRDKPMGQAQTGLYQATITGLDMVLSLDPPVNPKVNGTLQYYVQAFDNVGNRSESAAGSLTVRYCIG